ncbi:MAG: hypothetical protein ACFE0J_20510 [Elainellaceae cyanobacterium]
MKDGSRVIGLLYQKTASDCVEHHVYHRAIASLQLWNLARLSPTLNLRR